MWNRVFKTLVAFVCGQGLAVAEQLLLIPLFLSRWSLHQYGDWLSLSASVGFFALLDLGMNTGSPTRLNQLHAQGNLEHYRAEQHSSMAFYILIASIGTLLLTGFALSPSAGRWLDRGAGSTTAIRWTLWLLGLQALWRMPLGFLTLTFRTTGDMATTQWLSNGRDLLFLAATGIALISGADMAGVAEARLTALVLSAALIGWCCRSRIPDRFPGISRASLRGLLPTIRLSLPFWIANWAQVLWQHFPILLIRTLMDGAAVTVFVTLRTAVLLIRQAVSLFHNALWPELTALQAQGELSRLRELHRLVVVFSSLFGIMAAGVFWFLGEPLVRLWTRGQLPVDLFLFRLWLFYLVLHLPWMSSALFLQSTNQAARLSRALVVSSIAGILISFLLLGPLRSSAVPIGFLLAEALFCLSPLIREACQLVGEPYPAFSRWFWKGWWLILAGTLGTGWWIEKVLPGGGLFQGLLAALSAFCVAPFLAALFWKKSVPASSKGAVALRSFALRAVAKVTRRLKIPGTERLLRFLCNPDQRPGNHISCRIQYENSLWIMGSTSSFMEWSLFFFGHYEPEVARLIKQVLPKSGVAVDVGANIGVHTLLMAKTVGKEGKVIAVEPYPVALDKLRNHIKLNGFGNILLLPYALGVSSGRAVLHAPPAGAPNEGSSSLHGGDRPDLPLSFEIEMKTLDDVVRTAGLTRLDLVKVDVEGSEMAALLGGKNSVRLFRPALIFEYAPEFWRTAQASLDSLRAWLSGFGYRFFIIGRRGLISLRQAPARGGHNLLALPGSSSMKGLPPC